MTTAPAVSYRLKVRRVETACLFELSWGSNQQLSAVLPFLDELAIAYEQWSRAYLRFYGQLAIAASPGSLPAAPSAAGSYSQSFGSSLPPSSSSQSPRRQPLSYSPPPPPNQTVRPVDLSISRSLDTDSDTEDGGQTPLPPPPLRGRVIDSGHINPAGSNDRQVRLAKTEAALLQTFHNWLRSSELYEIRTEIQRAAQSRDQQSSVLDCWPVVDVFITCHPSELEYLPWEAWEIGNELATAGNIRIARYPDRVRAEMTQPPKSRRNRLRVLAIMGDDTGLDFQADREAVARLAPVADVIYLGYKPQDPGQDLKRKIASALDDDRGWDVLFFAGHSLESDMTGGELSIAPGVSISIKELAPHLKRARQYGLQLAVFNSCSGLSIANSTLDLGLTQVAIMREPVHNSVAQEFLVQLLKQLAEGKDSHDAVRNASQYLKLEKNLTYPSVHLVPSLFRHPDTPLFRVEKKSLKRRLANVLPDRRQAAAVVAIAFASLLPWTQGTLLESRTYLQALYRDFTNQIPAAEVSPPVLIVQIDRESIYRSSMSDPVPIDRSYLASLLDRLTERSASVIGIDYLLDRQQPENDPTFATALENAVQQASSWVVLATVSNRYPSATARDIAPLEWTLRGNINAYPTHVKLPEIGGCYESTCPFAYLLALSFATQDLLPLEDRIPNANDEQSFQTQLWEIASFFAEPNSVSQRLLTLQTQRISEASTFFGQLWLEPTLDFSIPPTDVYELLPAWQLLEEQVSSPILNQVVLIGAGGYTDSGIDQTTDYFQLPAAIHYWQAQEELSRPVDDTPEILDDANVFTGAEAHAYAIHHLLNRHLIIPIPDFWMVGLAALGGQACKIWLERQPIRGNSRRRSAQMLLVGSGSYALASVQVYVSAGILLPIAFPLFTLWTYVFLSWRKTCRD